METKGRTIGSILREMAANRNSELRKKVENVGRPKDDVKDPVTSKLTKQGEIKTKIIDEASLGDHEKLRNYANKNGGIDKDDFHHAADLIKKGDVGGLKSKLKNMDTDPRDHVISHVDKKHHSSLGFHVKEELEQIDEKYAKGYKSPWDKIEKAKPGIGARIEKAAADVKKSAADYQALVDKDKEKKSVNEASDNVPKDDIQVNANQPDAPKVKDKKKDSSAADDKDAKLIKGGKTDVDLEPKTNDTPEDTSKEDAASKKATKQENNKIGAKGVKEETMTNKHFGLPESLIQSVNEVLTGKQHKIDANKNGKIDAEDFKLLKKKTVKEGTCSKCEMNPCSCKHVKEEVEQLDEIGDTSAGKKALGSYIKKATTQVHKSSFLAAKDKSENAAKHGMDSYKRIEGIRKATDKLTKEEVEQIDEINKKTYVGAVRRATDPEDRGGDDDKIIARAKKQHGEKFAKDLEGIASKSHYPRPGHTSGYDKLAHRTPARVTAAGKANKQDVKTLKNRIKANEEVELSADEVARIEEILKGKE